jgi:hypothetical protein
MTYLSLAGRAASKAHMDAARAFETAIPVKMLKLAGRILSFSPPHKDENLSHLVVIQVA